MCLTQVLGKLKENGWQLAELHPLLSHTQR